MLSYFCFFYLKWTWFHLFFPGENLLQGFLVPKSESGLFLQTQISFLQIRTVTGAVPQIPVAGENAKRTRKPFVAHVIGGMVEQSRLANSFPDLSEFIVQNRAVMKDLALSGSQPGAGRNRYKRAVDNPARRRNVGIFRSARYH